jgi:beta-N-acetylhexosaminidase
VARDIKAFIAGCRNFDLEDAEREFLARENPWGLILFKRNIVDRDQVSDLVRSFREIVGRDDAPVLIDQEGGRVQRMGPPNWTKYPPAAAFAQACAGDHRAGAELAGLAARLMAHDLAEVGINVDCLPVLDVPAPGGHQVIGDRAYAADPEMVAVYGRAVAEGMMAGGVLPVIKHIPGHGRALADSHLELPRVSASRAELSASDFIPFKRLRDMPLAMTAHVVFEAIDPSRPGTISDTVIQEIIRGEIGFDGLLMTDDLSMKALGGSFAERTRAAFEAGVDMALHCNGDLDEASEVASVTPYLVGRAAERATAALGRLTVPRQEFDLVDARLQVEMALAGQG